MNTITQTTSRTNSDTRVFQLTLAAVYSPLVLLTIAALAIV